MPGGDLPSSRRLNAAFKTRRLVLSII